MWKSLSGLDHVPVQGFMMNLVKNRSLDSFAQTENLDQSNDKWLKIGPVRIWWKNILVRGIREKSTWKMNFVV